MILSKLNFVKKNQRSGRPLIETPPYGRIATIFVSYD